jgi:CO/xanthine dehydrogenase FAD-binding subunit
MDAPLNQIFFPSSFHELFSAWNRFPDAIPYAGGTELIRKQGKNALKLPSVILCLEKLHELQRITRTEHYLEIGSMVKLNRIIRLGKIVPEILCLCLENICGVQLRNIATIGGNICCPTRLLDSSAPLTALDAQYELRNAHSARWVAASRFHSVEEYVTLAKGQELLTRIRLPIHKWDYSMYKKFHCEDIYNSKVLVFLAKTQKSVLSDIRVVFKGYTILRNKTGEGILAGKNLPLSRKTAGDFIESWNSFLLADVDIDEFLRKEIIDCIEENVHNLSE